LLQSDKFEDPRVGRSDNENRFGGSPFAKLPWTKKHPRKTVLTSEFILEGLDMKEGSYTVGVLPAHEKARTQDQDFKEVTFPGGHKRTDPEHIIFRWRIAVKYVHGRWKAPISGDKQH